MVRSGGIADSEIVEAIYDGIVDGVALERAMQAAIDRLQASGGNIHVVGTRDLETRYFAGFGESYTDEAVAAFLDHWQYANAHRDAMRRAYERHGASVYLCHEHISEREWERAAYFQDFFARLGQRWLAGAMARSGRDTEVSIAFSRRLGAEPFGRAEARFITHLLPHVRRAASVALKLGSLGSAAPVPLSSGLAMSRTPASLVDAEARIHWVNPAGEELIAQCPDLSVEAGRLTLIEPDAQDALRRLVGETVNKATFETPAALITLESESVLYELEVLPASLPSGALVGTTSLALIMMRRRGLADGVGARLRDLYELTGAEADLALLIARGHSIDQAAEARGVRVSTVRAQMRSIFSKTGVNRANALAALVWAAD